MKTHLNKSYLSLCSVHFFFLISLFTGCCLVQGQTGTAGELKDKFDTLYKKIETESLAEPLGKLNKQYETALTALKESAAEKGNLDLALAAEDEMKAFQGGRSTSTGEHGELTKIQTIYLSKVAELKSKHAAKLEPLVNSYLKKLDGIILDLTKAKKLEEAAALREERNTVAKLLTHSQSSVSVTSATVNKPQGRLHGFGTIRGEIPVRTETADDFDDLVQVVPRGLAQGGWTALRSNGKVVTESTSEVKQFKEPITHLGFSNHLRILPAINVHGAIEVVNLEKGQMSGVPDTNIAVDVAYTNGNGGSYLALQKDGTVLYWGATYTQLNAVPPPAEALSNVRAIEMKHVLAYVVKNDGSVISWLPGGEQVEVPNHIRKIKSLAAGWDFCVALSERDDVMAWAKNQRNHTDVPSGLRDCVKIRAFGHAGAGQNRDGSWKAWGFMGSHAVEKINSLSSAIDLALVVSQATNLDYSGDYVVWIE